MKARGESDTKATMKGDMKVTVMYDMKSGDTEVQIH